MVKNMNEQHENYSLTIRDTNILRGIGIICILCCHIGAWHGVRGLQVIAAFGGTSLFLICSGYGLSYSFEKNGLNHFWIKKVKRVVIPVFIVNLIVFFIERNFSAEGVMNAFALSNINWYIKYILVCYFVFWITMLVSGKLGLNTVKRQALLYCEFIIVFIVDSLFFASPNSPYLHARQALMFPIGTTLYEYRHQLNKLKAINLIWLILGLILGIIMQLFVLIPTSIHMPVILSNFICLISNTILALCCFAFIMKYKKLFENKTFEFAGIISFELYLIHAYFLTSTNGLIDFTLRCIIVFILAYVLHIILGLSVLQKILPTT